MHRTLREACVAEGLPADAVRAGGVGAEVAAGGVAGAELGGGGRPLEHHRRGDPLAVRQARLNGTPWMMMATPFDTIPHLLEIAIKLSWMERLKISTPDVLLLFKVTF